MGREADRRQAVDFCAEKAHGVTFHAGVQVDRTIATGHIDDAIGDGKLSGEFGLREFTSEGFCEELSTFEDAIVRAMLNSSPEA